jgi:hypothetical protein
MTTPKKTPIPDPESLSEDERRAILGEAIERDVRETQNKIIARELARRAQETERRASS